MKFLSSLAIASIAILSGCGGGGSGNSGTSQAAPTLSQYVGTWQEGCDSTGSRDTVTIFAAANGGVDAKLLTEYFSNDNCTGGVVATQTRTWVLNFTRTGTQNLSVALPPSTSASQIALDNVNVATSIGSDSVTGTGITHDSRFGKLQWCFARNASRTTCVDDVGQRASSVSVFPAAMYTSGVNLYLFTISGTTVKLDGYYSKI